MAGEPRKPRIRPRRIIERPRLTGALDRSDARVRMLVAAAGYGKTTLAEQWAGSSEGRIASWFRARRSAADVTVVARGLVAAAGDIVPGAGRRLLQRLAVTDDPERETVLLAEMLAEDLGGWPEHGWIVIDEYEHLAASRASEAFVETVVSGSQVRLLIAGTVRPSWVAPRDILAGRVLEVSDSALALTSDEAADVLKGSRTDRGPGLVALTGGWPAVIGLAGMTPDAGDPEVELSESLYAFYGEELYRGLDPVVRTGLTILAEMPLVDRELAAAILGAERATTVCDEALRLGIFDDRDGYLDFHPLLATLFERRGPWNVGVRRQDFLLDAWAYYRGRGELDAAFDLTERVGAPTDVDRLVSDAMDELLDRARLPTLELWVSRATNQVGETTPVLLAQAEIALRQGRHLAAQAIAERVCRAEDQAVAYRGYMVAGKAAHVGSRENEALSQFGMAEQAARDDGERRRAKWGQLTAAIDLELEPSHELLSELKESAAVGLDPTEAIQQADKDLVLGLRFGSVTSLGEAKKVAELLPSVPDPFLRCSFGSMFSCALNLAAEYPHALDVAKVMTDDAVKLRVEFAVPYGYLMSAAALAGLRRFDEAHESLSHAYDSAVHCTDLFAQQGTYAGRVRALLHEGRVVEACSIEPPDLTDSLPAMRGEVWASRGLALACMGRLAEAQECAATVRGTTRAVEPNVLLLCIDAIRALKTRDSDLAESLRRLVEGSFAAGGVDLVVTTYRASPDLLVALLRNPVTAEGAGYVVARASDQLMAEAMGVDMLAALDPVATLSAREREVYDLMCDGLVNTDIATRLFISPATVKVHVRHVYDKLGIRSRTALALNEATRRNQAASIAAARDSSSSSADG
jgi:DNA-binding CsgD family transcriptional regulator